MPKVGVPRFVESRRSEILEMLRATGTAGVSKADRAVAGGESPADLPLFNRPCEERR
jgi:hypothetical protein